MLAAVPITLDPIFSGLAWALIFGLLVSTAFTLLVVPVTYDLVYRNRPGHGVPLPERGIRERSTYNAFSRPWRARRDRPAVVWLSGGCGERIPAGEVRAPERGKPAPWRWSSAGSGPASSGPAAPSTRRGAPPCRRASWPASRRSGSMRARR